MRDGRRSAPVLAGLGANWNYRNLISQSCYLFFDAVLLYDNKHKPALLSIFEFRASDTRILLTSPASLRPGRGATPKWCDAGPGPSHTQSAGRSRICGAPAIARSRLDALLHAARGRGQSLSAISSNLPANCRSCHWRASAAALAKVGFCRARLGSGAFLFMVAMAR
jgi:hypothetical protein